MIRSNALDSILAKLQKRAVAKEDLPKLINSVHATMSRIAEDEPKDDEHLAHDLVLYLDNERKLYDLKKAIAKNLLKKKRNKTYNHTLAPQGWANLIENAAKMYAKEFDSASNWSKLFPKPLRDKIAKTYADEQERALNNGEWDYLLDDGDK